MRAGFVTLAIVALAGLSVSSVAAGEMPSREIRVFEDAGSLDQAGSKPKCEGFAPTHFRCHMTWTITGNFGIRQAWANTFFGWTIIRWETTTGYGQSTCYKPPSPSAPPECEDEWGGHFEVGQTLVITAYAVGSGYWLVEVT